MYTAEGFSHDIYICSWSSSENATEQESKFVFFLILKNVVKLILIWTQAEHIILGFRNPSLTSVHRVLEFECKGSLRRHLKIAFWNTVNLGLPKV